MKRCLGCLMLVVVGCGPTAVNHEGWTAETSHSHASLWAVHAFSRTRVLAVGDGSKTVSLVDGTWRERIVAGDDTLKGIWGPAEDDVIIVGGSPGRGVIWHTSTGFFQYDGMTIPNGTPMLHAVHGTAHDDVWAVGDNNTALYFNGTQWLNTAVPTPAPLTHVDLRGVYCANRGDCWAVGSDGVTAHWNGTAWESTISMAGVGLQAIHGVGDLILIAGEQGTLLHVVNGVVGTEGSPDHSRTLYTVWAAGGNDAWAMGDAGDSVDALVFRLEGTSDWHTETNPSSERSLRAMHGVDSHLAWAVGDEGNIFRFGTP